MNWQLPTLPWGARMFGQEIRRMETRTITGERNAQTLAVFLIGRSAQVDICPMPHGEYSFTFKDYHEAAVDEFLKAAASVGNAEKASLLDGPPCPACDSTNTKSTHPSNRWPYVCLDCALHFLDPPKEEARTCADCNSDPDLGCPDCKDMSDFTPKTPGALRCADCANDIDKGECTECDDHSQFTPEGGGA